MSILPTPLECQGPKNTTNRGSVVQWVSGAWQESWTRRQEWNIDPQSQVNLNLFLGYQGNGLYPSKRRLISRNMIQGVNISNVSIQMAQPPKVKFSARESGEPTLKYLNTKILPGLPPAIQMLITGNPGDPLQAIPPTPGIVGIDAIQSSPDPNVPGNTLLPRPLNDGEYSQLKQLIQQSQMAQQPGMGGPAAIPPELIVEVNDATAVEALQDIFDAKWQESDVDRYLRENVLYTGIVGFADLLYQWDDDKRKHVLLSCPYLAIQMDPNATGVSDADYVIFDQFISKERGCALYPELKQKIMESATQSYPAPPGPVQYTQPVAYNPTYMYREAVILRTCWIRYQEYALSPQDAESKGLVMQAPGAPLPVEEETETPEIETGGSLLGRAVSRLGGVMNKILGRGSDEAASDVGADAGVSGDTQADVAGGEGGGELDSADDTLSVTAPTAPSRMAYFLVGADGQADMETGEIDPSHPAWPKRQGIRECRVIVGELVEDKECEFSDIPICHNKNIPIPYSPWGQGEPQRLQDMQNTANNIYSDYREHVAYNTFPVQTILASINAAMPKLSQNKYVRPGQVLVIPDDAMNRLKPGTKPIETLIPPPFNESNINLLHEVLSAFNDDSEHSEVLQGKAAPGWSGDAIDSLQSAAKGTILYKSVETESMLKYMANLMVGCIINRIEPEELARMERKVPIQCWYALSDWWRNNLDYEVEVEVISGGGANRMQRAQSLLVAFQAGVPIPPQRILEALDLDPDLCMQELIQWQKDMASKQQEMLQQSAPAPANPEEQSPQQPEPVPVPGMPEMAAEP